MSIPWCTFEDTRAFKDIFEFKCTCCLHVREAVHLRISLPISISFAMRLPLTNHLLFNTFVWHGAVVGVVYLLHTYTCFSRLVAIVQPRS